MNTDDVKALIKRKLFFADVGARWGLQAPWKTFRDVINVISFEPDEEEYVRLNKAKIENDICINKALFDKECTVELKLTKSRGCSSVYEPNHAYLSQYPNSQRFQVDQRETLTATSFDVLAKNKKIENIDFAKLDIQGAEFDVLVGGQEILSRELVGLEVEVSFVEIYKNQKLFAHVDCFVREKLGLQFQDLRKACWKLNEGIGCGAVKGQAVFGDALYFRAAHSFVKSFSHLDAQQLHSKIEAALIMALAYGYCDYALSLLAQKEIETILGFSHTQSWKKIVYSFGKNVRLWKKSTSLLGNLSLIFYRLFQTSTDGWATVEPSLGSKKKMGIFY